MTGAPPSAPDDRSGILIVDKPAGVTSHDVIATLRRRLHRRRIGHGGTLDPFATGVLPVFLGAATKLSPYLIAEDKDYVAVAHLGVRTDTLDVDGQVTGVTALPAGLAAADLVALLPRFRGRIQQAVPRFSAVQVDGVRLYARARRGEVVETPVREVEVHALALTAWDPPRATLAVKSGKGTYVRQLVADLGDALGVGAHVAALRRTRVGPFAEPAAVPLDRIQGPGDLDAALVPMAEAVARFLPTVAAPPDAAAALRVGRAVTWPALADLGLAPGAWLAVLAEGDLLAVAEAGPTAEAPLKLLRVFLPGSST